MQSKERNLSVALLALVLTAGCGEPRQSAPAEGFAPNTSELRAADPVVDISSARPEDWIRLFDGTDLSGWIPKIRGQAPGEDSLATFRVEDGAISVSYENYGGEFRERFGHLFHQIPTGWYHLRIEYRFLGDQIADGPDWAYRNSGIMIHGQTAASMGMDQDFPISIEVQLLGGNGIDERSTANLCTPGTNVEFDGMLDTRHCINSTSDTYHGDEWVAVDVTVLGDSLVVHSVEGQEVLRYRHPQLGGGNVSGHDPALLREGELLASGSISLQSESHPVQFRVVDLLPLEGCTDPGSPAYRSFHVHSVPGACEAGKRP